MTTQSSYRVQAVQDFIAAYNRYDIKAMVANLHPAVVFRNISHGKLTVETQGIDAFERQAEQGARLFRSRVQRIESISIEDDRIEVEIDYHAILAVDLPNLKAGSPLNLKGRSTYAFNGEKFILIEDVS